MDKDSKLNTEQAHSFHIPVMGTGFTIDTPLKVARYGISSVISLVDDNLIEKIREYYCKLYGMVYKPIALSKNIKDDHRACRIREYLNLVHQLIQKQIKRVRSSVFQTGSEIAKYFELLEDTHPLKIAYNKMLSEKHPALKKHMQDVLRSNVRAGSANVNIMTKLDRRASINGEEWPLEHSDALSALRGFATSTLASSVVFSAGLNMHLYSYVAKFEDFFFNRAEGPRKKVILKVSDYRSALTQGKIFAKKGIWVWEYRIESGLNCGGHAFATNGYLMGPVLEEFKVKREEFYDQLFELYKEALRKKDRPLKFVPPKIRLSVQGGIGTSSERKFLLKHYNVRDTGWATPFLLVPEVTNVDDETLEKLVLAEEKDLFLSNSSPLGVPFHNLKSSPSEMARLRKISANRPGSACFNKYVIFNTDFPGKPLCISSSEYQHKKIEDLKKQSLTTEEFKKAFEHVTDKSCICLNLGDGVLQKYNINSNKHPLEPAICPGPNIAYFNRIVTLRDMVDHIYGRVNIISRSDRPNMFIKELSLYVSYLKKAVQNLSTNASETEKKTLQAFRDNLVSGIEYYKKLCDSFAEESEKFRDNFLKQLSALKAEVENFHIAFA